MSDDGYYGEFDEFEDAMWDADPAPDLADDLAAHTTYSPVWQDDPAGELEPYYSDWEYYSDDYYDDDPVLKQTTLDGVQGNLEPKMNQEPVKRGRKRKLHEARQTHHVTGKDLLADCIKGTVWTRGERSRSPTMFNPGQTEGVALLRNWRDLFKTEDGMTQTFGRGQLRNDTTWANDLSLADMGLLNEHSRAERIDSPGFEAGEDPESILSDNESANGIQNMDDEAYFDRRPDYESTSLPGGAASTDDQSTLVDGFPGEDGQANRKRRRVDKTSPALTSDTSLDSSIVLAVSPGITDTNRNGIGHKFVGAEGLRARPTTRSRKRKMSVQGMELESGDNASISRDLQHESSTQNEANVQNIDQGKMAPNPGLPKIRKRRKQ